ncbi:MAG: class B sortase [Oscillospiraceae bacterium]|jgi:sortase B|nr:class B sortase [Oscillospiraceae bacterium]
MKKHFVKISSVLLAIVLALGPVTSAPLSMTVRAADSDYFERPDSERESGRTTTSIGSVTSSVYDHKSMKAGIKKYAADNSDVKGWLIVPNTNINKPITFSSRDNDYYIYRDIKGTNYTGITYKNYVETANYLDCRTVFGDTWRKSSRNTVIYGHNWTNLREPHAIGANNNHIMFGQLPSYTNMEFAKQNPHIYFSTEKNEGIWRVFSVAFVELSTDFNYNQPNPTSEDYEALIKELQNRSMFDFGVDVEKTDRILTLSTCTRQYSAGAQQRFIVVARLLRDGESEKDSVSVSVNSDMKRPRF